MDVSVVLSGSGPGQYGKQWDNYRDDIVLNYVQFTADVELYSSTTRKILPMQVPGIGSYSYSYSDSTNLIMTNLPKYKKNF